MTHDASLLQDCIFTMGRQLKYNLSFTQARAVVGDKALPDHFMMLQITVTDQQVIDGKLLKPFGFGRMAAKSINFHKNSVTGISLIREGLHAVFYEVKLESPLTWAWQTPPVKDNPTWTFWVVIQDVSEDMLTEMGIGQARAGRYVPWLIKRGDVQLQLLNALLLMQSSFTKVPLPMHAFMQANTKGNLAHDIFDVHAGLVMFTTSHNAFLFSCLKETWRKERCFFLSTCARARYSSLRRHFIGIGPAIYEVSRGSSRSRSPN